jgi:hypothetical protein
VVREETEVDLMFKKPYRVKTWFERDRSSIVVYDANDREIAEWWDDDVQDMFESGYFTSGKGERALADSVLGYVKEKGLDMPTGLDRAAKMRRVAAKRQGKNPPHWRYTMGELAAATRHLKSLQLHFTPEDIEIATGISPLIQSSMLRGGSVYSGAPEALSKMYHEKVLQNNPGGDVHLDIDIGSHNAAKGARTSVNPPRLMYHLPYRYEVQFTEHGEDFGEPLKFISESDVSEFMRKYPFMKMKSMRKLSPDISIEKNPPLPASALMDISTAKTVVREVDSGAREPRPALSQADTLLDRGLQKLRGSHLGNVDWSNPPRRWRYEDARGVKREGVFIDFADYGGTDVTYFFRRDDGAVDLVSGSRLKLASPIYEKENPPVQIISSEPSKTDSSKMVLHYKLTSPMDSVKDVERILLTLYPGWRAVAHASLREGTHPGVRHAYSVTLARSRKNPPSGNNPPATEVYRNIIEIRAEKKNGERFVHKFSRGSSIYGLPNGNILIASRSGKKLWKNFNTKG